MTSAGVIFKRCGCKDEATKRRLGQSLVRGLALHGAERVRLRD